MRAAAAVAILAGCGRIGFGIVSGAVDAPGDSTISADGGVRTTLRLDRLDPAATLDDFPLLVTLDDTRANRSLFAPGATDLRFYDSSGNVLAHEIEQVGTPGGRPLLAWVRVPHVVGLATTIDLTYGGIPGPPSVQSTWSSDYLAVWHFATAGNAIDSTTNHHDAVATGGTPTTGIVGSGVALAGTEYFTLVGTDSIMPPAFTVSAWGNLTMVPAAFYALVARPIGVGGDDDMYLGAFGAQAIATCEHANMEYDAIGGTVSVGAWLYFAGTATDVTEHTYLDGVQVGTAAIPGSLQEGNATIFIGADGDATGSVAQADFFQGALDEMRLQSVARDQHWLAYEVAAIRDQVITY